MIEGVFGTGYNESQLQAILKEGGMMLHRENYHIPAVDNSIITNRFVPKVQHIAFGAMHSLTGYLSGPLITDQITNHLERRKKVKELEKKYGTDIAKLIEHNRISFGSLGLVIQALSNLKLAADHSVDIELRNTMEDTLNRLHTSYPISLFNNRQFLNKPLKIYDPLPVSLKLSIVRNYDQVALQTLNHFT